MSGSVTLAPSTTFIDTPFPIDVGYGTSFAVEFSTTIISLAGGGEARNINWSQARRKANVASSIQGQDELAKIISHFHAAMGRGFGFRMKDWSDYTSAADHVSDPMPADQTLAIGDGVHTIYQLSKVYVAGSLQHQRLITRPVPGSVRVAIGGNELTDGWTVDPSTGILTFAVAPVLSAAITAGFAFDVPSRYDTDVLSEQLEDYLQGSVAIPVVELRVGS